MRNIILIFILTIALNMNAQVDSTYYQKAKEILLKYPKSKVKAEHLYNSAKTTYDETGIVVPYKLAISQAIIETSLGNTGVGIRKNNPFSLNSRKGYIYFRNYELGVLAYYRKMAKFYLLCKTVDDLLKNFVNCDGYRYATTPLYEVRLLKVYNSL